MLGKKEAYDGMLQGILGKYDTLLGDANKVYALAEALKQRFRIALDNKMDLNAFFMEEERFIDNLLAKNEADELAQKAYLERKAQFNANLDDRFEGREKAISIYKPLLIEDSHNDELMRLFGAIDQLDREHWSAISSFLREKFPLRTKSPLEIIENQLWLLVSGQVGKPPQALAYYNDCLRRGDGEKVDNVAFGAIKEAAFFLNDLLKLLNKVEFPADSDAMRFLVGIIHNFRIGDIKRKST